MVFLIIHCSEDDIEKEVSLAVNGEESRILFIDHEVNLGLENSRFFKERTGLPVNDAIVPNNLENIGTIINKQRWNKR